MEVALRHLRDGALPDGLVCATCCVVDHLNVLGGPHVFRQVLCDYIAALLQRRCQAHVVRLACFIAGAASLLGDMAQHQALEVVDMCSDPWGWAAATGHDAGGSAPGPTGLCHTLQQLEAMLVAPPGRGQAGAAADPGGSSAHGVALVIDCVSPLMQRYGVPEVVALLERAQRHPAVSCLVFAFHQDLHDPSALFMVERLSSCLLELHPLTRLQHEVVTRAAGTAATGRLDCRLKRRTGRLKVDTKVYTLQENGCVHFTSPPPDFAAPNSRALINPSTTAVPSLPAAAAPSGSAAAGAVVVQHGATGTALGSAATSGAPAEDPSVDLARAVGSSMRLTLTPEERQAKERVILPYQHQGQSRAYQAAGGDFKAYLPPAAGGHGPAAGGQGENRLGHILYVRDSEGEQDSDEDPDDDLDI